MAPIKLKDKQPNTILKKLLAYMNIFGTIY